MKGRDTIKHMKESISKKFHVVHPAFNTDSDRIVTFYCEDLLNLLSWFSIEHVLDKICHGSSIVVFYDNQIIWASGTNHKNEYAIKIDNIVNPFITSRLGECKSE